MMNEYENHPIDDEQFFCRFTFGQFFALLVIEVVALFFAFYLGARYGEKLLGFDDQSKIVTVGEARQGVLSTADPEVQKMARELMDKAKTPALRERIAIMLEDAAKEQEAQKQVSQDLMLEEEDVIIERPDSRLLQKEETASAPVVEQPDEPEPVDTGVVRVRSSEASRYSIQVGSYNDKKEADSKLATWRNKGYPAYMMIADIPNKGRWYRVRIGAFPNRVEAEEYVKRELSNVSTLIVLNEQ
jgi:cell division septation protein DedD